MYREYYFNCSVLAEIMSLVVLVLPTSNVPVNGNPQGPPACRPRRF